MSEGMFDLLEKSGAHVYKGRLKLPAYTSMGCYPLVYYTREMKSLCADCATSEYFEWLYSLGTCEEAGAYDPPVHVDAYFEGPDEICTGCNARIPSAYGDPCAEEGHTS